MQLQGQVQGQDCGGGTGIPEGAEKGLRGRAMLRWMQDKAGSGWSQGSQSVPGEVLKAMGGPQPPLREKVTWPIFPF